MLKAFRDNLLFQFAGLSLIIIVVMAVVLSLILTTRLSRDIDLLEEHGAAMTSGTTIEYSDAYSIPSLTEDVANIRYMALFGLGGGLLVLYAGLLSIVFKGSKTITAQRTELESMNVNLATRIERYPQKVCKRSGGVPSL